MARHCGISVFSFSLITNECILEEDADEMANHEEVIATANQRQDQLKSFVAKMIVGIDQLDSRKKPAEVNGESSTINGCSK